MSKTLEWKQVVLLASAAYSFLPKEHSKESPLLQQQISYLGNDENMPTLEALKIFMDCYQLI